VEVEIARERQRTAEALAAARSAREDERARLEAERLEAEKIAAREKREAGQRRRVLRRQNADVVLADDPAPAPERLVVPDEFAEFREEYDHVVPEVFRHMPLAAWARTESWKPAAAEGQEAKQVGRDELRDLFAGLRLPPQVAHVTYARGCRIRRVRVPGSQAPAPRGTQQTVILSRRALEDARTATR
jgi:hypothetical protein